MFYSNIKNCEDYNNRQDCKADDLCVWYNTKVKNDKGRNIWKCKVSSDPTKQQMKREQLEQIHQEHITKFLEKDRGFFTTVVVCPKLKCDEEVWQRLCVRDLGIGSWKTLALKLHNHRKQELQRDLEKVRKLLSLYERDPYSNYKYKHQQSVIEKELAQMSPDIHAKDRPEISNLNADELQRFFMTMPHGLRKIFVYKYLGIEAFLALCSTNKELNQFCNERSDLWKSVCIDLIGTPKTWEQIYKQYHRLFADKPYGAEWEYRWVLENYV